MQRIRTFLVSFAVAAALALGVAACVVFAKPELMMPGPWHPRAIYCRLMGYGVHPWVRVDPSRPRTLRLWSTRWPVFRDGYGYDDLIDEAVTDFRRTYPGVEVEYVLLGLDAVGSALSRALANSTPPDICIGPFDPSTVASGFVVPLDMFLRRDPKPDALTADASAGAFEPRALEAVTVGGRIWAWPAWIAVRSWAVNARLLREAGVDVERIIAHGWTFEDVIEMVRALARGHGLIMLDATSARTLTGLMRASGQSTLLAPDGSLGWDPSVLRTVMSFLDQARREGAFPDEPATMGQRMLELFWTGKAAAIGPVGPGFGRHVRERTQRVVGGELPAGNVPVEAVLVPVPHAAGSPACHDVSLTAASVFRVPGSGGTDTARLAVEFALLLARKEATWLARELAVVPAHLDDRGEVLGSIGPNPESEHFLLAAASVSSSSGYTRATLSQEAARIETEVLEPALSAFWDGELDVEGFISCVEAAVPQTRSSSMSGEVLRGRVLACSLR